MKTKLTSVIIACLVAQVALAIPQTFRNGFFGAAGQQFEDFAVASLDPGADMKGKWAVVAGKEGTLRLDMTAVVFGVPASEVIAQKSGDHVSKYIVTYSSADDRKRGKSDAPLKNRVIAGVSAYTGGDVKAKQPAVYKGTQFLVQDGAKGDVVVEISKAP